MLASAALNTSSCDSVRIPPKLTEVVKAILEFFFFLMHILLWSSCHLLKMWDTLDPAYKDVNKLEKVVHHPGDVES